MTVLIRVTDLEYSTTEQETTVEVVGRAADGKRKSITVKGTQPYLFANENAFVPRDAEYVLDTEEGYEGYDGVPLRKVTVRHPKDITGRCKHCDVPKDGIREEISGDAYEADIPFIRRVAIDYGLSGYIMAPSSGPVHVDEIDTDIDPQDVGTIEPRVLMADIEAMPPEEDEPFSEFKENASQPVTAITFYDTYTEDYTAIVLDGDNKVNGGEVREYLEEHWEDNEYDDGYADVPITLKKCSDEASLLDEFIDEVKNRRPDVFSGWNWVDFDHTYLEERIRQFDTAGDLDNSIHNLSDIGTVGGYKEAQLIDGLPGFDMLRAFCGKMTFSEWRSEALDYVAQEELGLGKVEDVSVGVEYERDRSRFLAYNIIDTQLLVALDKKHGIHEFFFQLADLCACQVYDAFHEKRLVDGFMMSHRENDEILPSAEEEDMESIPGGLVLTPSKGVHEWVAVFDLKSLYPSVFITLNVSKETLTYNEDVADLICPGMPEDEDSVGGNITEADINWKIGSGPGDGPAHMNAIGTTLDGEGVLPKYLRLLFDNRADMKAKRDQFNPEESEYTVYDNRQRAIKVVMNSFYGVTASKWYRLATEDLGATITAGGRYTLWQGAQIAEDMGYEVRYGDSVPEDEPVVVRINNEVEILEIQELMDIDGDIEVWSDDGFTDVRDVIKKPAEKDLYTTRTKHGIVTTTEDHGLLLDDATEVRPTELNVGQNLLHADLADIPTDTTEDITTGTAWLYGLFCADGSCRVYDGTETTAGTRQWTVNNENHELLQRAQDTLAREFDIDSKIYDTVESSGCYKLSVSGNDYGKRLEFVKETRDQCYSGEQKRVPPSVLTADEDVMEAFLEGYHAGDGYVGGRYVKKFHQFDTIHGPLALGIAYLLRKTGREYNVISTVNNHDVRKYRVTCQDYHRSDPSEVERIERVERDVEYVYDLDTERGHFHAGVGSTVVHNTDSVMIELADPDEDVTPREVAERGNEVEEAINKAMDDVADDFGIPEEHPYLADTDLHGTDRHCLHWEFEKLYRRFIQAGSKKRYAGLPVWKEGKWYVDDPDEADIDAEGIKADITGFEAERADVPEITERVQRDVLHLLLGGSEFEETSEYLQDRVEDVENLNMDLHKVADPGVINKPLEEYPNRETPRACEYSNKHLDYEWREGRDPWIYPIKSTPPMLPDVDVLALEWNDEIPDGFELDIDRVLNKIRDPLNPILGETEWTFEELKSGRQMQAIDVGEGDDGDPFAGTSSNAPEDPFANIDDDDDDSNSSENQSGALDW